MRENPSQEEMNANRARPVPPPGDAAAVAAARLRRAAPQPGLRGRGSGARRRCDRDPLAGGIDARAPNGFADHPVGWHWFAPQGCTVRADANLDDAGELALQRTVRDLIPKVKAAGGQGIVEYPLNKIVV